VLSDPLDDDGGVIDGDDVVRGMREPRRPGPAGLGVDRVVVLLTLS
jgi:hypothetical protein